MTVVIPKVNTGDYLFNLNNEDYQGLLNAARTVAKILERAFNTPRVALIFEGMGVAHVHAKLAPLHGKLAGETGVWSEHAEFYPEYVGYLTTVEGPRMSDEELDEIRNRILNVQK